MQISQTQHQQQRRLFLINEWALRLQQRHMKDLLITRIYTTPHVFVLRRFDDAVHKDYYQTTTNLLKNVSVNSIRLFLFGIYVCSMGKKYDQLVTYKEPQQRTSVSRSYKADPQLVIWVQTNQFDWFCFR